MSESTLIKMPNCRKSHVAAHIMLSGGGGGGGGGREGGGCTACGIAIDLSVSKRLDVN